MLSSKLQVKAEFMETCSLADWCPTILSFQTGMDDTLLNYMYLCVCVYVCKGVAVHPVVFQFRLQKWHPSVGQFQLSFSSGIRV